MDSKVIKKGNRVFKLIDQNRLEEAFTLIKDRNIIHHGADCYTFHKAVELRNKHIIKFLLNQNAFTGSCKIKE